MKKRLLLAFSFMVIIFVSACSEGGGENSFTEPIWLEVEPLVEPESPQVNETVTFKASVTYGDKKVEDADDVKFEIWRAHDEEHITVEAKHVGDGVYQYEMSFDREGTYYFIAHVTAENMHNMPRTEFVIGEPSEPEEDPNSKTMDESHEHEGH